MTISITIIKLLGFHLTRDGRDMDLGGGGKGKSDVDRGEVGGGREEGRGEGAREGGGAWSNAGVKSSSCMRGMVNTCTRE